jgi:hypothetical protein
MARLGKFLFDIFIQRLHIIADKLDGPMYSKGKHVNKSENSILLCCDKPEDLASIQALGGSEPCTG